MWALNTYKNNTLKKMFTRKRTELLVDNVNNKIE